MNFLFVHQGFPGQFRHLAPALAKKKNNRVLALTAQPGRQYNWLGVQVISYCQESRHREAAHPWLRDFQSQTIRGEACLAAAIELRSQGFIPDVIVAHSGWGEAIFLKDVWPNAKIGVYFEYFYQAENGDCGFDPEFPVSSSLNEKCRIRLKNLSNLMHLSISDAGLSPTHWQASQFPDFFRERLSVIHDGVNTDTVSPGNSQSSLNIAGKVFSRKDEVVTFASRVLEPCRGFHVFMRAVPEILKSRPNAKILIAGSEGAGYGPLPDQEKSWRYIFAAELMKKISAEDWPRVHFIGHLPYQKYLSLLQISTVHAYLTYPFVLSWSVIEAMSAGCAIVGSRTAPVIELIEHNKNGLLVDFFDHEALANSISQLLADRDKASYLASAARQRVIENYDLCNICLPKQEKWISEMMN